MTPNLTSPGDIQSRCTYYSITYFQHCVCSQLLIYTAEWTGALWRERRCQSFETVAKGIRTQAPSIEKSVFYRWANAYYVLWWCHSSETWCRLLFVCRMWSAVRTVCWAVVAAVTVAVGWVVTRRTNRLVTYLTAAQPCFTSIQKIRFRLTSAQLIVSGQTNMGTFAMLCRLCQLRYNYKQSSMS